MKHLLTFENYNPVAELKAKEYVDHKMSSGDVKEIFDIVGEKMPDKPGSDEFEKIANVVREKAIKHYIKNPEHMRDADCLKIGGAPVKQSSVAPKVQNIGGVVPRRV